MYKRCFSLLLSVAFCLAGFCQDTTNAKRITDKEVPENDSAVTATTKKADSRKEKDMMARNLTPANGKALIYILRPSGFGALIRMAVLCDSVRIGSTKSENYVYVIVDPGAHKLESHAETNSSMDITVEAGKTYYVRQQVKMGFAYAETGLKLLDEKDGQKDLKRCRLAKDNEATK